MNWTLNGYKNHWGSFRCFKTRAEARRFAKQQKIPYRAIVQTLQPVNSAMDDWNNLYSVAPDGSYDNVAT